MINKQNLLDENANKSDEKYNDDGPGYNIRTKLTKISTSWLLITNDKDFVDDITITPGIYNIYYCQIFNIKNYVKLLNFT